MLAKAGYNRVQQDKGLDEKKKKKKKKNKKNNILPIITAPNIRGIMFIKNEQVHLSNKLGVLTKYILRAEIRHIIILMSLSSRPG